MVFWGRLRQGTTAYVLGRVRSQDSVLRQGGFFLAFFVRERLSDNLLVTQTHFPALPKVIPASADDYYKRFDQSLHLSAFLILVPRSPD